MAHSKRWLLLLANLALVASPSIASAGDAGRTVGRIAGGCCGHVASAAVGGLVKSAIEGGGRNGSSGHRTATSSSRPTLEERCDTEGDAAACEERCFIEDDATACLDQAQRVAIDGLPDAAHRALAYLDRACAITRDPALCDHVQAMTYALNTAAMGSSSPCPTAPSPETHDGCASTPRGRPSPPERHP